MSTKLFAVKTALGTIFTTANPTATVYPGPRPRGGSAPRNFLLVGADGGDTGLNDGLTDDALSVDQEPSQMGNDWLVETGAVRCSAWAWSGDADFDPLRTQVQAMYAASSAAVKANPHLSGALATVQTDRAWMSGFSLRETQTKNGPYVRAVFTVAYSALITT